MPENADKRNNDAIGIDVVLSVLESGHSVELPATGYSMFPTLRPGDSVVVRPLTKEEVPGKGSVVVYIDSGTAVQRYNGMAEGVLRQAQHIRQKAEGVSILGMHRLVEIKKDDSGDPLFITRGDSMIEADKPWDQKQLVGVAVSYKRGNCQRYIKNSIPENWRYKFNRRMLWIFSLITRLTWGLLF